MLAGRQMRLAQSSLPDEQLIRLWVKHAHVPAFDALYERHKAATRSRIASILRPYRLFVDDLVQDTWITVATTSEWRPRAFRPWVQTVATRHALERVARHERTAALAIGDRRVGVDSRDAASERDAALPARLLTRALIASLSTLPSDQRDAWTLRYLDAEEFEEIARQQDVPVHAAKTRVRLAEEELVSALEWRGVARPSWP